MDPATVQQTVSVDDQFEGRYEFCMETSLIDTGSTLIRDPE